MILPEDDERPNPEAAEKPEPPETDDDADDQEGDDSPEPEESAEGEEGEGEAEESGEDKPKPKQTRAQRYKQTIERLKAEVETLKSRPAAAPAPRQQKTVDELVGPAPKITDYRHVAEYQAALAGWEAEKRFVKRDLDRQQQESQARQQQRQNELARSYAQKQQDARTEMPDYDKVVTAARLEVEPAVADAIMESEHTARIEYHLAKNPQTLARLNNMSPLQAAREIGRLEAQLSRTAEGKRTQAPSPLKPMKGGAGPKKTPAEMDMDSYAKWYEDRQKKSA